MKLRSIALVGLLGAGLLMTSGCGEDDVIDAVNDALKANVIHVANANSSVDFTVDGVAEVVDQNSSQMFVVEGKDSYDVSYGVNTSQVSFPKDSAHLYALCASGLVIIDSATGSPRQIDIINLSGTDITNGGSVTVILKRSGLTDVTATVTQSDACSKQALTFSDSFALSEITGVEVNGLAYVIPPYDQDVEDVLTDLNSVDFDIVVFDPLAGKGTIVPLATAVELGKATN